MAKKITGAGDEEKKSILNRLDEVEEPKLHNSLLDDYGKPLSISMLYKHVYVYVKYL